MVLSQAEIALDKATANLAGRVYLIFSLLFLYQQFDELYLAGNVVRSVFLL